MFLSQIKQSNNSFSRLLPHSPRTNTDYNAGFTSACAGLAQLVLKLKK